MIEAAVLGRVGVDLYPNQLRAPLRDIRTYTRFVGGFAGNVSTGLARLGIRTAIISRVGDDGHGEFVRNFLSAEGVDVRFVGQDGIGLLQQGHTGFGGFDPGIGAHKQCEAKFAFEDVDCVRQRGLAHMQPSCRSGNSTFLHHCYEGAQFAQVHHL